MCLTQRRGSAADGAVKEGIASRAEPGILSINLRTGAAPTPTVQIVTALILSLALYASALAPHTIARHFDYNKET